MSSTIKCRQIITEYNECTLDGFSYDTPVTQLLDVAAPDSTMVTARTRWLITLSVGTAAAVLGPPHAGL